MEGEEGHQCKTQEQLLHITDKVVIQVSTAEVSKGENKIM